MTMKTHTNRHIIHPAKCLLLLMGLCTLLFACQQDDFNYVPGEEAEDEMAVLTYNVSLNGEAQTRAIGDGQSVDQLLVGVFLDGDFIKTHTFENRNTEGQFTVSIPLLRQEEYTLVFWAQKKDNGIYTISEDDMQITIDYSQYDGKSLQATEAFEVFWAVKTGVTVSSALTDGGTLSLTRPFAQVNVAAAEADILDKVKRAELTLTNLPTGYNPLTGAMKGNEDKTFTFTDFTTADNDNLTTSDGEKYSYLATVWALSTTTDITVNLYDAEEGGNTVRDEMTFTGIELKPNVRLNIVGNMIQQQTMAAWDGVTFSNPADKTPDQIQCPMVEQITRAETTDENILHIETPDELAYILKEGIPTGYTGIHICQNLDMGGHDWNKLENIGSIEPSGLPAGTLISALSVNEGEHFTVSNIIMDGNNATGLFGDVENLTVKDITFSGITITNGQEDGGVGIVAGTAYGNLSMSNVSVEGGSLQASSGKAGGLVGKIVRIDEDDRSETLQADFNSCTISGTAIYGTVAGKFVGEFSGYDYNEVLNFYGCSTSGVTGITTSDFCNDRKSCFIETSLTEDHFLGREVYCRGTVNFDGKRFVPKWDGTRTVEPLLADATYDSEVGAGTNKFVVYSPFDLAGVRKKTASPAAIYLRADIDMNGQGQDGRFNVPSNFTQSAYSSTDDNVFDPFSYCTTLDGKKDDTENYSIHNLSIAQIEQERAAFILYASGTTVHKNINFRNCQTVAVHKPVTTDAKAYGAILVSNVDATYTMENVHAYDCKVFALQKVGTLGARISGTSTLKNNSVNNCYVENYECMISERFDSGTKEIAGQKARVYADFYPHGEVGGMYGFIQGTSTLTGCSVNETTVYAFGQNDKQATVEGSGLAQAGIAMLGYYLVPGRHVGTMIGNIRATGTVTLTGCSVDSNSQCTNRWDKHTWRVNKGSLWRPSYTYYTYDFIGQAYYVKFLDSEGTVTVDGTALTVGDCKTSTLYGTY